MPISYAKIFKVDIFYYITSLINTEYIGIRFYIIILSWDFEKPASFFLKTCLWTSVGLCHTLFLFWSSSVILILYNSDDIYV